MTTNEVNANNRGNRGEFKQWMGLKAIFGHLHQFREIPNSDPPAHSVRLSVPQGRGENIRYSSLELIVDSLSVFHLLSKYADKINDDAVKSTLTFNCYGLHPKAYALKNKDGSLKLDDNGELALRAFNAGKLTHISYLKIDNIVFHGGNSGNNENQPNGGRMPGSLSQKVDAGNNADAKVTDSSQATPALVSEKRGKKSVRKATA
jgi:hypothetical protein